jgi:CRISPR-associated endonuclease/helicase Cas3
LHLSTLLCGAHRREVLTEVRRRLARGEPCRVISTQVVEAGVDLDFPLVLRALGPLDRIVQAAGRCNREGRLGRGRVVVFRPAEGKVPPGSYRIGTELTGNLLARGEVDVAHPATFPAYFRRLYDHVPGDRDGIQRLRAALEYEAVADAFRLIDDDTASVFVPYQGMARLAGAVAFRLIYDDRGSVLVPYGGVGGGAVLGGMDRAAIHQAGRSAALLEDLRQAEQARPRRSVAALLRRAQPYLVSVRRRRLEEYAREGLAMPLFGDLWEWRGRYDAVRGLSDGALDPSLLYVG